MVREARIALFGTLVLSLFGCDLFEAGTYPFTIDDDTRSDGSADVSEDGRTGPDSDSGPTDSGPPPDAAVPEMQSATETVSASSGGAVTLRDGTVLTVPAGALAEDTAITVSRLDAPDGEGDGVLAVLTLEPAGLTFAAPASIRIPYDPSTVPASGGRLGVVMASALNTPVERGGEIDVFDLLDASDDGTALVVPIAHFSMLAIAYHPDFFVVPVIPQRYLRPGDILYTMTSANQYLEGSIWPTHVGLFAGDDRDEPVIESTKGWADCGTVDGVQRSPYAGRTGFNQLCGQHIFFGARRPPGATEEQGRAAAAAAVSYIGTGYGIVGLSSFATGLTCVQLAEQSWETAGVNMAWTPDILLSPWNQYVNTVPVDEISVHWTDPEIRIPVMAIHNEGIDTYTALGGNRIPASATLTVSPAALQLEGRAQLVAGRAEDPWVAEIVIDLDDQDAGVTYELGVRVTAPTVGFDRVITRLLRVHVAPGPGQTVPGTGDACEGAHWKHFEGVYDVVTDPGGPLTVSDPDGYFAYIDAGRDGGQTFTMYCGDRPQCAWVNLPIAGTFRGGGVYVYTHPRTDPPDPEYWSLNCPVLPGGGSMGMTRFENFIATTTLAFSDDCKAVEVGFDFDVEDYDDGTASWVRCSLTGSFSGVRQE